MNHRYIIDYVNYVSYNVFFDECAVFDIEYDDDKITIVFGGHYKGKDWRYVVDIKDKPDYDLYNEDGELSIRELAKEFTNNFNHVLSNPND